MASERPDTAATAIDPNDCDAVVFDMDGVLTDTARLHARAWKELFDEYLERRAAARGESYPAFDPDEDYARHVDGRARLDGVRAFLAARGIALPEGEEADPPDRETVCGLGNRKNALFLARLREQGVDCFDDALALVRALRRAGVRTAVISASRNAPRVLERAGIADLFDARIDGGVAAEKGLAGKPEPDVPLAATWALDVLPRRAVLVEDAPAGVQAGRRAGFERVIGVARRGGARRLAEAGADVVVAALSEVTVAGGRPGETPAPT